MKTIKIDTNVPVPESAYQEYNWANMNPGESFFMTGKAGVRARMAGYNWARRNGAKMKSVRVEEHGKKGIRVWRIS